jgi:uncharacterized protein involved in cysteine biosynthesis
MISALLRAFADLSAPPIRRLTGFALLLALASFVAVWIAAALVLGRTTFFEWGVLNWVTEILGGLAVLVLSWIFFPAVVTIVTGFFLDRIAAEVEALHYPGRGPPRRSSVAETVATTVRLMALTLLLNALAVPIYILAPGINVVVFLVLNGYLFGREYFEVVALRRLDPSAARAARRQVSLRVFLSGVVIAGLFAIPLVNLVAAVLATAFMVHHVERMRLAELQLPAS